MNRALLRISLACLVMFVLLLININYVQAFQSSSLAGEPENTRAFSQQFLYQARGDPTPPATAGTRSSPSPGWPRTATGSTSGSIRKGRPTRR